MKSFQLDPNSVSDFLRSWPSLLFAILLSAGLAYVGCFHVFGRLIFILFAGCFCGFAFQGHLFARLKEKYPGTHGIGVLSAGFAMLTLGVCTRMIFPELRESAWDSIWLALSFVCIGWFVFINRKNPAVYQ